MCMEHNDIKKVRATIRAQIDHESNSASSIVSVLAVSPPTDAARQLADGEKWMAQQEEKCRSARSSQYIHHSSSSFIIHHHNYSSLYNNNNNIFLLFYVVDDDDLFRKFATRKCLYSNEPNNVPGGMSLVIVGTNLNFGGQRGSAAFFTILPFVYALDRIGKHGSLSMQPF